MIPNGFDPTGSAKTDGPGLSSRDHGILITFVGTLYRSTNPAPVIEALHRLPENLRSQLKIRFIGYIEDQLYREELLSLGNAVELAGFVPHSEALKAIGETDYVLLISHDKINVPAKFYDYIGGGRPILAAIHPDSEVRRLLEDLKAGWWADVGDVLQIQGLLEDAVQWRNSLREVFAPDLQKIARFTRQALSLRYAELLKEVSSSTYRRNSTLSQEAAVRGSARC
jgi:glycosyltransferase involved in cell wall biosynthesis